MIIAVASGKGGTGKTTLSIAISKAVNEPVQLLDCDVEEPNAHIFLKLSELSEDKVNVPIPIIDDDICIACGKCAEVCQFNALAVLKDKVLVFDDLCHSCGGCARVCPVNAIDEINKTIGEVTKCEIDNISFIQGKLDVGKAMSPPVIRAVKSNIKPDMLNIIDCPPGNACPVITSISGADFVILVTEATPFGLHDLKISVDTLKVLDMPFGVVINRADSGYEDVVDYCVDENIGILLTIPESLKVAKTYSSGGTLLDAMPEIGDDIRNMIHEIKEATK